MLSRLAREFAAEIASHDWSDAPYRLDRAGHQRRRDSRKSTDEPLGHREAARIRTNVMWVTAQVLKHSDPNLDLHEYAEACGIPRWITHRTDGSRSDAIKYGLRWNADGAKVDRPGAPLWLVSLECSVPNPAVFKRLLINSDGLDPAVPPVIDSFDGVVRHVVVAVREWDQEEAERRGALVVTEASLSVLGGAEPLLVGAAELKHG